MRSNTMPSRVVRRLVGKDTAQQNPCLFDHLVGAREQRRWHFVTERLGGLEIDHQLELPVGNSRRTAERRWIRGPSWQKTVRGGNRAERRAQAELLFGQSLANARN